MKILLSYIIRKNGFHIISFGLLFIVFFTPTLVIAQSPNPNCVCAYCGYACGTGHASNCPYNSSTKSDNTNSYSANRQALREARQEQRRVVGLQLNDKGNEEYRKQNWAEAIKYYKKAVRNKPDDDVIRQNLKLAEDAYAKRKSSEKDVAEFEKTRREYDESQRKWKEEQKKKDMEQQLALQKASNEAIEIKLKDAQQKISALQKDVSGIQQSLRVYSKSLQNNSSEFEKWGATVDEAYNNVIDNSKGYLASMFLKYNLLGGLEREEQKIIFNKLRDILGSTNPELQKWLVLVSKSKVVDLAEVEDIIDKVNQSGDLAVLLTGDKNNIKHNLDALLLANSLIEGFNLAGYKDYIKNIAKPFGVESMPGDYYEQAKMIGETYADLTSICYSWFMINKLSTDNEATADKINLLSFNMQHQMKEIDCLKKSISNYTAGSIEKCTGVSRFSTPPPLLR